MRVLVRADASVEIGSGHLMRCLTLADQLRGAGADVAFACRDLPGGMFDSLHARGYRSAKLPVVEAEEYPQQLDAEATIAAAGQLFPDGVDWLVIDHYALDAAWEHMLRPHARKLMVIDDLANRNHECDLLLDQNDFKNKEARYHELLPPWCTSKLGSTFFLLRPEFGAAAITRKINGATPERLFLFFGGSDPCDVTSTAIDALLEFDPMLHVDVVIGAGNHRADKVAKRCALLPNARLHRQTNEIAQLMAGASLALGAGGITTYERLAVGLYAITVATAANQIEPLEYLAAERQLTYLGLAERTSVADWINALSAWHAGTRRQVENESIGSAIKRLVDIFLIDIRRFGPEHIDSTFNILADAEIRKSFAMTDAPTITKHRDYWGKKLADAREHVFALHYAGNHIGNMGLKPVDSKCSDYEAWIYMASEHGKGLGEFSFRQLIKYAFCDLKLPRLIVHVLKDNRRAISLYEKIGFHSIPDIDSVVWGTRTADIMKMELCK